MASTLNPDLTRKLKEVYIHNTPVPTLNSLDDLINELHKVFAFDRVNVDYVKSLLSAYRSNPADWKKYAKFDPFRYTRNLVDTGNGKFNLIALCWGEGHGSSIHDHSSSQCFVKILDGELMETMYSWPPNYKPPTEDGEERCEDKEEDAVEMKALESRVYRKDQVTFINDSMGLHRMSNPSHSDKTVSLHLYCPPFETCNVFDQRSGKAHVTKVTFWSKYGLRTPYSPSSSSSKMADNSLTSVNFCCHGSIEASSK